MVNSETNLYDFITEFNISIEELPILGFFDMIITERKIKVIKINTILFK